MTTVESLQLGKFNRLEVIKELDFGMYLKAGFDEILLPTKYIPEGTQVGDVVSVFVYRDSEDRLIATNLQPKVIVGEIGYLEVVDANKFGVFLDWGLEKDLFLPFAEQSKKMIPGNSYVVKVILDERTQRIIASARIERFLIEPSEDLEEGQEVILLPFDYTDLGIKTIVNGLYLGMLYHNEVFKKINIGDSITGFIKKIRPDNKIDLSLTKQGYEEINSSKEQLLEQLKIHGGVLPFTDKSSPESIYDALQMSKKNFKKAVGGLLKEQKIILTNKGIQLISEE